MHRPIPGARFIACLFAGASLFGGATAVADASLLGFTQFVAVPTVVPGGAPIDPASITPTKEASDTTAKTAEAKVAEDEFGGDETFAPRLRPTLAEAEELGVDNAG